MFLENLPPQYLPANIEDAPTLNVAAKRAGIWHGQFRKRIGIFLTGIEAGKGVMESLREAHINPRRYAELQSYPEFRWLYDSVKMIRKLKVEDKSFECALNDKKNVLERIFLLKSLDHSYRDKQITNQSHITINIDASSLAKAKEFQASLDVSSTNSSTTTE